MAQQIRRVIDSDKARKILNAAGGPFRGYPYLVTHIVPTLIHIIVLPNKGTNWLKKFALEQARINNLPSCLALADQDCLYVGEKLKTIKSKIAPFGHVVFGKLKPAQTFEKDPELAQRKRALVLYEKSQHGSGYLMGDLRKGGRRATTKEIKTLSGQNHAGYPNGLAPCAKCGQLRGECLDPSDKAGDWLVPVHCICDNRNFCAQCGETLNKFKLNGNNYNAEDGQIWHNPAFTGLNHVCAA